MLRHIKAAT